MKLFTTVINFLIVILLILSPIVIIKVFRKNDTLSFYFLLIGVLLTFFLTLLFAWWSDYSNQLILTSNGYNFEAIDESNAYKNVAPENLESSKQMIISMMGIGWPVKAVLTYIFYLPYLLLVFLINYFARKPKN